jgi:hypothetical protein
MLTGRSDAYLLMRLEFFNFGQFSTEKSWQIFSNDPGRGMWLEKAG